MPDNTTGDGTPSMGVGREGRAAMAQAIAHLKTIETGLEPFDREKNRETRRRLENALESAREENAE